jgi:hypothetical protein
MHNPHPLADKVYDALRGSSAEPKEHELRFTNFARQATAVLMHASKVVAEAAFKPGFRTDALVKNLTEYQNRDRTDYEAYCTSLANAYAPKEPHPYHFNNKAEAAEIFALMDGVISFHYPTNMIAQMDYHVARFEPDMTDSMMAQLKHKHNVVTYYHEPDFNDTPFDDVIGKQPYIQNYLHKPEDLHNIFGQFQKLNKPYLAGLNSMNGFFSSLLFDRAYRNTKHMQFKLHFDTDNSIITASGPLFDKTSQSFKENGFTVSEYTAPLTSTTPHPIQSKLWSSLPEQKYYVIS